ncbi:MAG TPA: cytochrome c [Longimicrobiales bacterium]|nr:cytochrome c [Longimicrobiales bacterium]
MKQMLAVVAGAAAALLIAAGAWLAFVYSGFYDVAASREHSALTEWTLETISERSIARRAGELPGALPTEPGALLHGLEHYRAMCQVCHAAPGIDRSEIGAGLNPRPPRLERAAAEWSDAELFWIVKHGITSTGMPAFGATHDDEALLQIVALVRRLPELTPGQYADLIAALAATGMEGHHGPADSARVIPHVHAPEETH